MRANALVVVALLFCALGLAAEYDTDDQLLTRVAAHTEKLHRVTESVFKMDSEAAAACGPGIDLSHGNPHSDYYCHVFISDSGQATMKSGKGIYPAGTVIVKQKLADRNGKKTVLFTLMRKMEDGYDADNGNWEYSIVDRTARKVLSRGRTDSCIDCHS